MCGDGLLHSCWFDQPSSACLGNVKDVRFPTAIGLFFLVNKLYWQILTTDNGLHTTGPLYRSIWKDVLLLCPAVRLYVCACLCFCVCVFGQGGWSAVQLVKWYHKASWHTNQSQISENTSQTYETLRNHWKNTKTIIEHSCLYHKWKVLSLFP